ncbi:Kinesin-like protein KIN-14L [Linum grandiflorum]
MESSVTAGFYDVLASRKAEEAVWRRYQATEWLESLVGPLSIPSHPSEKEFISRLRNGLILCNAINKVVPGSITKVVENHVHVQSLTRESQPLPAYQYFENVKNFLVAMEDLKLPAFEASDLERDTLEAASTAKVVDSILALKLYHEHKNLNGGNGVFKPTKSPMVAHNGMRSNIQGFSSDSCRQLEMNVASKGHSSGNADSQKLEDELINVLAEYMADTKENMGDYFLNSFRSGNVDPMKLFGRIVSSCLKDNPQKFPEGQAVFMDSLKESSNLPTPLEAAPLEATPLDDLSEHRSSKCCGTCLTKGNCNHRRLLQVQERELQSLKTLLSTTRKEFEGLQFQLQSDLTQCGIQVQEMSTAAQGYQKVLKENRILYNMVQDLKGNIRVYCRVRPSFTAGASNAIQFIGEDGSLVIGDPSKPTKDGRRHFQFSQVFGPTATQENVFDYVQPLIRSVMDGHNACIFAYGQTGSGKTYTMSGPSGGSTKELGINYLALTDLFQMSNRRKDVVNYDIRVQMVEIYNEQIRDLLAEDSSATKYPFKLSITVPILNCTGDDGLTLPDATLLPVTSTSDVLHLMKLGEVNRVVSSTEMNNRSSRSHSVLTVHVHGKDESGANLRGCLHLVDLAGSERVDKSEVTGDRLMEATYINQSLSCLGDVVTALAHKNSYIPYRNSKLTLLLQDSLGCGHAKTLMFAHVSPEEDFLSETMTTLKFAQRVSSVELGTASANKESREIMQLKEQVENLKRAVTNKQQQNQINEARSPIGKSNVGAGRTPPMSRRLSIENGSNTKLTKTTNHDDKKAFKTPPLPTRPRRLSLEAPTYSKKDDDFSTKKADDETIRKPLQFERTTPKKKNHSQSQDVEATTPKQYGYSAMISSTSSLKIYHNTPKSPTSASYQRKTLRTDSRTQIPHLQLPLAAENQVALRNEVQIVMQSQVAISGSVNGKGSQLRKSLRTIGKLINGSEKRKQRKEKSEAILKSLNGEIKSPVGSSPTRAARRQSLTGVYNSRRTSIGGNSIDLDDSRRYAKTPPPAGQTPSKRWM